MSEHRQPQGQVMEDLGLGAVDPEEIVRTAEEAAREHPHGSLAGAFALGFLLGGGLTPRLLVSLILFVGRRYAGEAARETLGVAVQRAMSGSDGEPGPVEDPAARP